MNAGQEVRANTIPGMTGKVIKDYGNHSTVMFKPIEDTGFIKTIRNDQLTPLKQKTIFDEAREIIDSLEREAKETPTQLKIEIGRNVYHIKTWLPLKRKES